MNVLAGFSIARRNLLRQRRRSLMTVLLAALGTAALLIAGGFADYTYQALREGSARESGHLLLAHASYFSRDEEVALQYGLADAEGIARRLLVRPEVSRVLPRLAFSGLISNGDKSMVFVGQGVDIAGEMAARGLFLTLRAGRLPGPGDEIAPAGAGAGTGFGSVRAVPKILLGEELAKSLKATPGSGLTLLATTTAGALNALDVEVAGVVSSGVPEVDKRLVYAPLTAAQRLLVTDKVSLLAVYLDDEALTEARLAAWRAEWPHFAWRSWTEEAFYYRAVRGLYDRVFGLLGAIIATLVFFSVANTLSMAVIERTREIGTLRALGALPREIVAQFVREGGLIGATGALVGMLIASLTTLMLLVFEVRMPPPPGRSVAYPLQINALPALYLAVGALVVVLCALAALWASRRAARHEIVEALRHV